MKRTFAGGSRPSGRWAIGLAGFIVVVGASAVAALAASPSAKDQFMQNETDRAAKAQRTEHTGVKPPSSPPAPDPVPSLPTGVLATHQGPFSSSEFVVNNAWQGYVQPGTTTYTTVFAGSTGDHSGTASPRGALWIFTETPDSSTGGFTTADLGVYDNPLSAQGLTIQSFSGALLTITETGGGSLTFDVATRQFV